MKNTIEITANCSNWKKVYEFFQGFAAKIIVPKSACARILIAAEEIFVNISHYAYPGSKGSVRIEIEYLSGGIFKLTFLDSGIPFDPTKFPIPDITLEEQKRTIGGLGIFIAGKMTDTMRYYRIGGKNRLVITKKVK